MTYIGPDFGDGCKWYRGAINDSGVIYYPPFDSSRGVLKIDTFSRTRYDDMGINHVLLLSMEAFTSCQVKCKPYHEARSES